MNCGNAIGLVEIDRALIKIAPSLIPNAGNGVFACSLIPPATLIGGIFLSHTLDERSAARICRGTGPSLLSPEARKGFCYVVDS